MSTMKKAWYLYCPNCQQKLTGLSGSDGKGKVTCRGCHAQLIRTDKSRRHVFLDIYMPEDLLPEDFY